MKEQLLSADDRAALQSLIPLAGAVGAGTIFSLFAGTRRGAGLRVFEVFAIVAVLTAAASTAAIAIDLLHAGEAISNRDLTQTAMPLVIATLLLVVVSVFNRVSESFDRALVLLPMVLLAVFAAAGLVVSSWSVGPGSALWAVAAIFLVGIALSGLGWELDRRTRRSGRGSRQRRVADLVDLGYVPVEIALGPALPSADGAATVLSGWERGGVKLLGYGEAERLRDQVRSRWEALAAGECRGPVGASILLDVRLDHWLRNFGGSPGLRAELLRPGEREKRREIELAPNADGLFDVSELVR